MFPQKIKDFFKSFPKQVAASAEIPLVVDPASIDPDPHEADMQELHRLTSENIALGMEIDKIREKRRVIQQRVTYLINNPR